MNRKHKLTVNQLAVGNLKMRKKQYLVLIVGIILSIAFSASILFFYTASQASTEERRLNRVGEQQFIVFDSEGKDLSDLYAIDPNVETATVKNVAFAYLTQEEREYGMCIAVADEAFRTITRQTLSLGRMPVADGEIAIEASALSRIGLDISVGDTFTVLCEIPDGNGGVLKTEEQTYTLVGILTDKRRGQRQSANNSREGYSVYNDFPAAYLADTAMVADGGKAVELTYGKWDQPTGRMVTKLYNETDFTTLEVSHNTDFFYDGYYTAEDTDSGDTLYMLTFLGIILVAGSCFGIVTAFNMNLQERRRQIGLLRAVGTTKRQIVNIFGREALIIALFSVPAGLLLSYLGVLVVVHFLGDGYVFRPEWEVFVLSALLGIAVVLLAAMIPLLSATRITPMQALRNTDISVKMKHKKIKMKTDFRAPNLLAMREIRLNGAKQSGVAVFVALGLLLSVFGTSILTEEFKDTYRYETDFYIGAQQHYLNTWTNVKDDQQFFTKNDSLRVLASPYVKEVFTAGATIVCIDTGNVSSYLMTIANQHAYDYENLPNEYDTSLFFAPNPEDMVILPRMRQFLDLVSLPDSAMEFPLLILDDKAVQAIIDEAEEQDVKISEVHAGQKVIAVAPDGYWMKQTQNGGYISASITERTTKQELETAHKVTYRDAFYVGDTLTLHWLNGPLEFEQYVGTDEFTHLVKEVEIGAVIPSLDIASVKQYHTQGIYASSAFITTWQGAQAMGIDAGIRSIDLNLVDYSDENAQKTVNSLLKEIGTRVESYYLFSNYEWNQQLEQDRNEVWLLLAALLMLFFCISAATLCNSTNAKIRESRRIIGTLRAVGASAAELRRIYLLQYAFVFGIGGGIGFGGAMLYRILIPVLEKLLQREIYLQNLTWWVAVLFVALLFAVCMLNLTIRLHREMKNSIVENIREL